jgi:phosphoribosylanthranilate isomerase
VNETAERVREISEQVGLTAVQLQGDEEAALIGAIQAALPDLRVLKTLSVPRLIESMNGGGLMSALPKELDAYLLDSGTSDQRGGTGLSFDWHVASQLFGKLGMRTKLIVAGGLTAENVAEAIRLFRPYGVDVCSGTEASPGKKDHAKIRAFVDAVRACDKTAVT